MVPDLILLDVAGTVRGSKGAPASNLAQAASSGSSSLKSVVEPTLNKVQSCVLNSRLANGIDM